jgi:transposase
MPGNTTWRYPPELKERAVRMVVETMPEHESEWAAMGRVAELLGVGTVETVRKWVRQAEVDASARPWTSSEESTEIRRLKREVAEAETGQRDPQSRLGSCGSATRHAVDLPVSSPNTGRGSGSQRSAGR